MEQFSVWSVSMVTAFLFVCILLLVAKKKMHARCGLWWLFFLVVTAVCVAVASGSGRSVVYAQNASLSGSVMLIPLLLLVGKVLYADITSSQQEMVLRRLTQSHALLEERVEQLEAQRRLASPVIENVGVHSVESDLCGAGLGEANVSRTELCGRHL